MNTFVDDQNHRLQEECILFPWIELGIQCFFLLFLDANNQPIIHRYKSRSLLHKAHMRLDPVGGSWGLFGWHTSITLRLFPRLPSSQEGAIPCDY